MGAYFMSNEALAKSSIIFLFSLLIFSAFQLLIPSKSFSFIVCLFRDHSAFIPWISPKQSFFKYSFTLRNLPENTLLGNIEENMLPWIPNHLHKCMTLTDNLKGSFYGSSWIQHWFKQNSFFTFFWLNDITTTTVSDSGYAREYSWYGLPYHHKRNSTVFYHIG